MSAVGQRIANIEVGKGVGPKLKIEGGVFSRVLIDDGIGHRRRIVRVGNSNVEGIGDRAAVAVVGNDIDADRAHVTVCRRA